MKVLCTKVFYPINISGIRFNTTLSPSNLNTIINRAAQTRDGRHATQIHAQIVVNNCASVLPFVLNNLISLYCKCGGINQALLLFSTADDNAKTVVTWTSLISHFSHAHKPYKALELFRLMKSTGEVSPNQFTFSAVLPACSETLIIAHGEQMHSLVCKMGYESDIFVGSAMVDMYSKCGDMGKAMRAFDEMPERNLVSWNAMIVGFTQNRLYDQAVRLFLNVLEEKLVSPDQVSFSSALSACANLRNLHFGRQIHGTVIKDGLVDLSYVKNSLMDMYSKCRSFEDAVKLFRTMEHRDVVTWNVVAMGWAQNDLFEEACSHFWAMRREGICPDEASFSTVLHASANLAALDQGTLVHDQIIKSGFIGNLCIASSLITMYSKCGSLVDAFRVFNKIDGPNVVCWTAIIAACQQHGNGDHVIELFGQMLADGVQPDYITLVCVLSACSHTGRLNEGLGYFNSMRNVYGIEPGSEHYACVVDMLGRAGRLDEAKTFIEAMPISPDSSVWGALLGACRNYKNLELGKEVAEKLFEMEPDNPGNYVLLSNLYTCCGMLKEANEVRRLMGVNRVRKEPGCSWIDTKNKTYVFTVHDKSHPQMDKIYKKLAELAELVKKKGYVAETQFAVNDAEEFKEQSLWYHSEKLALAFGLLTLPANAPIRIKKNLRTCGDCHAVMKFASEIFNREIIVRDINRFHRFADGFCSCRDYW
ncbi:hypothetical protein Scep_030931 [Stephania cephalantha]|uniref:DYW domain-containing protein n=1 Tax=Stephania cephalantha TaxID=152367 RepID=A0AAP0E0K1_9MAGN